MTIAGVAIGVGGTTRALLADVVVAGSSVTGVIVSRQATVDILRATIRDNADGGVIVSRGTVSITDSTIRDNQAEWGGGIRNLGGRVTVRTSTISGNSATTCGGISSEWSINGRSKTTVERSTIAANDATFDSGGICNDGVLTLRDSVVGDNSSVHGPPDCATFSSRPGHRLIVSGSSLIENTSGCTTMLAGRAALLTGDPLLGPLQDNGGPTDTQALLPGSPAIGVLTRPASCKKPDQRGVARAVPCDLGAFEAP